MSGPGDLCGFLEASEAMGIRGEPSTTTLLNQHDSQLHSKHLSLYWKVAAGTQRHPAY